MSVEYSETILPLIYSSHIREQLTRFEELRNNRVIYVTELVSCSHKHRLRQLYPELTISFEPITVTGHLIHIGVEKYLVENGFQTEYPVKKTFEIDNVEYVLKGKVDAYHPEKRIIVEIKSSRNITNKPLEHHVEQLQIYLNLLNVETGILLYITPVVFREYRVERKDINLANLVKSTIRNENHPRWNWECNYCVFKEICSYRIEQTT
uniref:CRISPR-associated exonuclease Cas4 n=1 Tax=Staphylothermus marinus TaxID=2280 RepID=A0A7J3PKD1_STAMA